MRTRFIFGISVLFMFVLQSCQRQPKADFRTDKTEYVAGETIQLKNTSIDGKSYKWTVSDGQTSTLKDLNYTTDLYSGGEVITFKLEALSRTGKKTSDKTKSIKVNQATGNTVIWTNINSPYDVISVNIYGLTALITSGYSSAPDCGASGCAVFNGLPVGIHTIVASDGTTNWSSTITISKDQCTKLELQ